MAVFNVQSIPMGGGAPTFNTANAGGDSYQNSGNVRILARNTTAGAKGINIEGPGVDNFGIAHATAFDQLLSVPAAAGGVPGEIMAGPFPQTRFNDANGRVQMTYPDNETGMSVAVIAG